jgi:hypothetical protein
LRCVLMHQWRDACCQAGVLGQIKDPANRRKKFYAAREQLLDKGKITVDSQGEDEERGRVYPTPEGD